MFFTRLFQPATFAVHITDTFDRNAQLKLQAAYIAHADTSRVRIDQTAIAPAQSTTDIGIIVAEQIYNSQRPARLLLAVNCAPAESEHGVSDNARSDFYFAELTGGDCVGGTLNGYELSYIKDRVAKLYRLTTTNALKSQFRSLEVLPKHLLQFANPRLRRKLIQSGALVAADTATHIADIPDVTHVVEVDNFGNVKVLPSAADRALLTRQPQLRFAFAGKNGNRTEEYSAIVRPTLFAAPIGSNVIALNSGSKIGKQNVAMIATIRGHDLNDTAPAFDVPGVGTEVHLSA